MEIEISDETILGRPIQVVISEDEWPNTDMA